MIGRRQLGPLDVSAIALGCMSMTPIYGQPDPDEAIATLHRATDIGIDFIDTSDAYGANGANDELVGRALQGRREKYILATKFGILDVGEDARNGADAAIATADDDSVALAAFHRGAAARASRSIASPAAAPCGVSI